MRHTFGTTLAVKGVEVRTIMELMGHRDLKTTMKYLYAVPDRMKRAGENLGLDGTTHGEADEAEGRKLHRSGQDMDTGTDTAKIPEQ